ncbi:MAG TPA: hypothetical protein VLS89_20435 [Candidatus Nanopelagicales bacterium]|nr:hypothetical protein [Candidatus Nanopelagicales bacterium]
MNLFGNKRTFAFQLLPLAGAPREDDPSAAATWAELQIWLDGKNITQHVHTESQRVDLGLHWPVIYFVRWLVRSWPKLFEQQVWPLAGWLRNARDVCNLLDQRLLEIEDALEAGEDAEDDPDAFAEYRDDFVSSHALASGAAGGLVPDVYFARDGDRVSVALGASKTHPNIWFLHERGERDVSPAIFLDAVRGLVTWTLEQIGPLDHPVCARDREELSAWLDRLRQPEGAIATLLGYIGIDEASLSRALGDEAADARPGTKVVDAQIEAIFDLPPEWKQQGALFDPSRSGAAMVFRALSPSLAAPDVLRILQKLRSYPRRSDAGAAIATLQWKLPSLFGGGTDYDQGYHLAEAVRALLGNTRDGLDIEGLLRSWGIGVEEVAIPDATDVDGGAVWDEEHGPVLLINPASPRASTRWGRRMVLAHELCHLLVDRVAAVPLKIMSGAWAPPVLERRANAFAAELLFPRLGIVKRIGIPRGLPGDGVLNGLMDEFDIGRTVCIEHIQNRFKLGAPDLAADVRWPIRRRTAAFAVQNEPSEDRSGSKGLKALLMSMPDVGDDSDFERPVDRGRGDEPWDS